METPEFPSIKQVPQFSLRPNKHFYVFPIIVLLELAAFLAMVFLGDVDPISPKAEDLLDWGGVFRTSVLQDGEYWRLFGALFVHAGVFHLAMNALKIWLLGSVLEPALGWLRSLLIFLLGGFAASLVSLSVHSATVVVGCSGAAFALIGVLVVLVLFRRSSLSSWFPTFFLILMLVAVDLVFGTFQKNIDNAAHLGGFLAGLVLGALCLSGIRKPEHLKRSVGLLSFFGLSLLIYSFFLVDRLEDPVGDYRLAFREFAVQEDSAMMAFELGDSAKQVEKVKAFESRIIHWQRSQEALEELRPETIPAGLQQRVSDLKLYCQLRKKQFQLVGLYYRTYNDAYFDQAEEISAQIISLRERLFGKMKLVIPD